MTLLCKIFLILRMKSKLLIMAFSALYDERFGTPISLFSLTTTQPYWPVFGSSNPSDLFLPQCFYLYSSLCSDIYFYLRLLQNLIMAKKKKLGQIKENSF